MNRSWRAGAVFLVLVLAVSVRAQPAPATRDATQRWQDIVDGIRADEKARTGELRKKVNDLLDRTREFLLLGEAQPLAGANDLGAEADRLEQALQGFQRRLSALSPLEAILYRDTLFELGRVCAVRGEYERAVHLADQGWQVHRERCRPPRPGSIDAELDEVQTALKAAVVYAASERPNKATSRIEEALERCERPQGPLARLPQNPLLAHCWLLKGSVANTAGSREVARSLCEKALDAFLKQYPPSAYPDGTPEVTAARGALAAALVNLGQGPRAWQEIEEARRCLKVPKAKNHPALAVVYRIRAQVYLQSSKKEEATDDIKRALEELADCSPSSHPAAIQAKTALATLLNQVGRRDLALRLNREVLQACQARYGEKQHENKVFALLAYGLTLRDAGRRPEAHDCFRRALKMAQTLHPDAKGDLLVARCLLLLGALQGSLRDPDARNTLQQAQEMYRGLPESGPPLAAVSCYLGEVALQDGDRQAARRAFTAALGADQEDLRSLVRAAAEVEVLTFMQHRRLALSGYLTATRDAPDTDEEAFAAVWASKGVVTRLAQARRSALRLAQADSLQVRRQHDTLRDICARRYAVLSSGREQAELQELTDQGNRLEVQLSEHWPEALSQPDYERYRPGDLAARLPPGSAFIDFVRYDDLGALHTVQPCYAAFIVAPGGKLRRVELGPAPPIEETITGWRKAVGDWLGSPTKMVQQDSEYRYGRLGQQLRHLIWDRLGPLPQGTQRIYLGLDSDLALFPFAALPGDGPDTLLLKDCTLLTVPNGPFLLEQLQPAGPVAKAAVDFLAVGDVDYGPRDARQGGYFGPLSYSGEGLLLADKVVAPGHARTLRKAEATYAALCAELPRARLAHLSTHGFYDKTKFEEAARQLSRYWDNWSLESEEQPAPVALGSRYPLSYVGLALSGANEVETAQPGILSGEPIMELPLGALSLVTLGACDTGSGDYTAGEGIQAIQRAFHLAGCPNVVATLWSVPDRATQLFMLEYYHQLWDRQLPSEEALHQAQLAIYDNPGLLTAPDVRRGSIWTGGPDLAPPLQFPLSGTPRRHAPVACWAAFVHSGVGQPVVVPLQAPVSSVMPSAPPGPSPLAWALAGGLLLPLVLAVAGSWWRRQILVKQGHRDVLLLLTVAGSWWRRPRGLRPVPASARPLAIVLPDPPPGAETADAVGADTPLMATLVSEPASEEDHPSRNQEAGQEP